MILLVAATLVGLANARPEAPSGYNYNAPQTRNQGYDYSPPVARSQPRQQEGYDYTPQQRVSQPQPQVRQNEGYDYTPAQPQIHKHIYVHVAPPEPQVETRQRVGPTAAPQKHYKIIFIKAPSQPTPAAPIIPEFAQNQEKTLIYVLVKRPEDAPEINVPTPSPTQPSKPEVYFIKYQTRKETTSTGTSRDTYGPPPAPQESYGVPDIDVRSASRSYIPPPSAPKPSYGLPEITAN